MPVRHYNQNFIISNYGFSAGDYAALYIILSTYDWSSLYNETSVDAAVDRLNVAVTQAVDSAVPSGYIKKHKYPAWISVKLIACIRK
jgi:hypothetical protein